MLQKEVAKALEVPVHSYLSWEKGKCEPLPIHWPRLIEFIGTDPLEDLSTLKGRVDALRRRSGLTQRQIVKKIGVSKDALHYWLMCSKDNIRVPQTSKSESLFRMLKKYGV